MRGNAKRWEAQLARKQAPYHRRHIGPRNRLEFIVSVIAMVFGILLLLSAIAAQAMS